ncbi:pyridoxamine 5'-phosphate oxidase family protein [Streptomyces abyssomicinicus]|uniref:pyridoxamine 5'-phosphate oxidase family protein n=1 Tax=Streptomyces abyssomicinicus TaxID=574929 RepID=UPI0012500470|nr:pyridoxamine 5'-phosphate oxidase family protein [Streptomyces abyssomicinicus]
MSTYHPGELAVQERAGLATQAAFSLGGIGDTVPPVAREFLAGQPMIVLGAADERGRMWATLLTGPEGFLRSPDPGTLVVHAPPAPGDPLAAAFVDGRTVRAGLIAVEPATRRRMRLNGRARRDGDEIRVALDQVIANCPKYLQRRQLESRASARPHGAVTTAALGAAQQAAIVAADTFFVATASVRGDADASHRGGNPGFVQVLSPTLLRWPDYVGNAMFLTLGNLHLRPEAGLLFPDWETGSLLHLTGAARTVWDETETVRHPGAQRLVEFSVAEVREVADGSPLRWSKPQYSRFNP